LELQYNQYISLIFLLCCCAGLDDYGLTIVKRVGILAYIR
jgi:hypothetical protein